MDDDQRILRLEEKLMHLEHDLSVLDGCVRDLGDQVVGLDRQMQRLGRLIASVEARLEPAGDPTDAADQKPPHW